MIKIGVLMGGLSDEREISLLSGKMIVENLNPNKYDVVSIVINKKEDVLKEVAGVDHVFIALHGSFGEDGSVQALLESISMPYTGCNVVTSALCMNKKQTKRILTAEGIIVPKGFCLKKHQTVDYYEVESLNYPMIVKPNSGGSSIATFKVKNREELVEALKEAFKHDAYVLVEECLNGGEYTVPVLNGETLPILEINPNGEFFDFKSKYTKGEATEEVAIIPKELEEKMRSIAFRCWDIFDCHSYVRVDFMLHNGEPYVLELNTLPGMTENSLFPKSAKAANVDYSTLLDRIIMGDKQEA